MKPRVPTHPLAPRRTTAIRAIRWLAAGALRSIAFLCAFTWLCLTLARAGVIECQTEFVATGEFHPGDVAVFERLTGRVTIGTLEPGDTMEWQPSVDSGLSNLTSVSTGYLYESSRQAYVLTSVESDHAVIGFADGEQGRVPLPSASRAAIPYLYRGGASGLLDDGLLVIGGDGQLGTTRVRTLQLTGTVASVISDTFLDGTLVYPQRVGSWQMGVIVPGIDQDTFVLMDLASLPPKMGNRMEGLPHGIRWALESRSESGALSLLFWRPGSAQVIRVVQSRTVSGRLEFGAALDFDLLHGIEQLFPLEKDGTAERFIAVYSDGTAGLYEWSDERLQLVQTLAPNADEHFTSCIPLGERGLLMLSGLVSQSGSSAWKRWEKTGNRYVEKAGGLLPSAKRQPTGGNVLLFDSDPFQDQKAHRVGGFSAGDWTSAPSGLPSSLQVRVETFQSIQGLGNPSVKALSPLPATTQFIFVNQLADDVSFYNYAPFTPPVPAQLGLALRAPDEVLLAQQPIELQVTVRNNGGQAAEGSRLEWLLQPGMELLDANATFGSIQTNGNKLVLELGNFPANTDNTLRLSVRSTTSGSLTSPFVLYSQSGQVTSVVSNAITGVFFNPVAPPHVEGGFWSAEQNVQDSLGTNDGVFIGTEQYERGKTGAAFRFDGQNYIRIAQGPPLLPSNNAFTLAAWIKPALISTAGNQQPILAFASPFPFSSAGALAYNGQSLTLEVTLGTGSTLRNGFEWQPDTNLWYHVAGTFDGTNQTLYVNGCALYRSLQTLPSDPIGLAQNSFLYIGGDAHGGFFRGTIDDALFANTALSEEDILRLYHRVESNPPQGVAPPGSIFFSGADQTIWRSNPDGSLPSYLTMGKNPKLSPDGRHLLFERDALLNRVELAPGSGRQLVSGRLYAMDLDTLATRLVLEGSYNATFDWTRDSDQIVFAQYYRNGVFRKSVANTELIQIGDLWAKGFQHVVVSPLDGRLAADVSIAPNYGIWVANADGSDPHPVPNTEIASAFPSWSPDGEWIAFRNNTGWFKIRPDGSGRTRLTPDFLRPGSIGGSSAWNADGSQILVVANLQTTVLMPDQLFSIPTDGSGKFLAIPTLPNWNHATLAGVVGTPQGSQVDLEVLTLTSLYTATLNRSVDVAVIVTNRGPTRATGIQLTGAALSGGQVRNTIVSQGTVQNDSNALKVNLGTLSAGAFAVLRFEVLPATIGVIRQEFSVGSEQADTFLPNNTGSYSLTVRKQLTVEGSIVYERSNGTIWSLDGSGNDRLVALGHSPKISPDGNWILYELNSPTPAIVKLAVGGLSDVLTQGSPQLLGNLPGGSSHAAEWADSGSEILYAVSFENPKPGGTSSGNSSLLRSHQTFRLARDPIHNPIPAHSSSGEPYQVGQAFDALSGRAVFTDNEGYGLPNSPLQKAELTIINPPFTATLVRYSEEGSDPATRIRTPQTAPPGPYRWPSFSSDGAQVAFLAQNRFFTVRADGSGLHQITDGNELEGVSFDVCAPKWTLDGHFLIAIGIRTQETGSSGARTEPVSDLYAIATDGTGLRRLPIQAGASPIFVGSANTLLSLIRPEWIGGPSSDTHVLRLRFPADDPNLRLESAETIGAENWQPVQGPRFRLGHDSIYENTVSPESPPRFFRLRRIP